MKNRIKCYIKLVLLLFLSTNMIGQNFDELENKAFIKMVKGDYQNAKILYDELIKLDKNNASAYSGRARCRMELEDNIGSISDCTISLTIMQKSGAYFIRASSYLKVREFNLALMDCNSALKLESNNYDAIALRADIKTELGDYYGAIDDYNKAMELSFDPARKTKWLMAKAFIKTKEINDLRGAIIDYSHVIKLDNNNIVAIQTRGVCKYEIKDYNGALEDANLAINIDLGNAFAYYLRGLIKLKLNNKDDGCLDFSRAGELGYIEAYEMIKLNCQ